MSLFPLFAVPFVKTEMPDPASLNAELANLFLLREAEGPRWRNRDPTMGIPNGLFESNFDLFSWPESCVQRLHEFCMLKLFDVIGELNGYPPEELRRLESQTHAWFHITRRGGRFSSHNHPMATWSGVYCVSPGASDAGETQSGVLHFHNPHQPAGMYIDPGNQKLGGNYTLKGRNLSLLAGDLVLFPSWLIHEVFPFYGEGQRITVAFNCAFRQLGASTTR